VPRDEARDIVRRNIDAWWPLVHRGLEAIVVTASGCGVMVKDYGHFLAHDAAYAAKAKKIADLARDPDRDRDAGVEEAGADDRDGPGAAAHRVPFAVHAAARHAHPRPGRGDPARHRPFAAPVADTQRVLRLGRDYSVLQPVLSGQLKANKLRALESPRRT
jgi:glycolate oxidase iron-sulfur subunit